MPLFENNGNGVTIPKWLLPILVMLFLTAAAAWAVVSFQAKSALPRIEAAQTYVPRADYELDRAEAKAWCIRIEGKLDRALQR